MTSLGWLSVLALLLVPTEPSARVTGAVLRAKYRLVSLAKSIQLKADYGQAVIISNRFKACEDEISIQKWILLIKSPELNSPPSDYLCAQRAEQKYIEEQLVTSIETFNPENCEKFRSFIKMIFIDKNCYFPIIEISAKQTTKTLSTHEIQTMVESVSSYYDVEKLNVTCDDKRYHV